MKNTYRKPRTDKKHISPIEDKIKLNELEERIKKFIVINEFTTVKTAFRIIHEYKNLNISIRNQFELTEIIDFILSHGYKIRLTNIETLEHKKNYLINLTERV